MQTSEPDRLAAKGFSEPAAYTITPIPLWSRILKAAVPLGVGALVSVGLWNAQAEGIAGLFLAIALWVSWKLFGETEAKRLTRVGGKLTAAAKLETERIDFEEAAALAAKEAASAAKGARMDKLAENWWFRYPMAAVVICGSVLIAIEKPGAWWIAIAGLLVAGFLAKELALLLLGIGAVYLLFLGVAALPVSVAVIVGAIIIASALRR